MSTVEAIKNKSDIELLKTVLKQKDIKYYLLFIIGINTGLRIGDILNLKISDFINEKGELLKYIIVKEQKTNKLRRIAINTSIQKALKSFLSHANLSTCKFVFSSRKSKSNPLSTTQAYRVLTEAAIASKLDINFGTHSMRKTWGYWTYKATGNNIGLVMDMLNHSSPAITLRYIGITQEQKDMTYMQVEL